MELVLRKNATPVLESIRLAEKDGAHSCYYYGSVAKFLTYYLSLQAGFVYFSYLSSYRSCVCTCEYACICAWVQWYTCGGKVRKTHRSRFSVLLCRSWGSNQGHQTWWQVPASTEPSCQPDFCMSNMFLNNADLAVPGTNCTDRAAAPRRDV